MLNVNQLPYEIQNTLKKNTEDIEMLKQQLISFDEKLKKQQLLIDELMNNYNNLSSTNTTKQYLI
jgi:septal ring factor EnvC (AmiA/AmiB activator)